MHRKQADLGRRKYKHRQFNRVSRHYGWNRLMTVLTLLSTFHPVINIRNTMQLNRRYSSKNLLRDSQTSVSDRRYELSTFPLWFGYINNATLTALRFDNNTADSTMDEGMGGPQCCNFSALSNTVTAQWLSTLSYRILMSDMYRLIWYIIMLLTHVLW